MQNDFDNVINRSDTSSFKWSKYKGTDIIPMWVADMDFKAPAPVRTSLQQLINHGVFGYSRIPDGLNEVIAESMEKDYSWNISPEMILWHPCVLTGLAMASVCTSEEGDAIVTFTPIYPPFLSIPATAGRECIRVPMVKNGKWEFDMDLLRSSITERTRVLYLCNPQNPTGRVMTRDELVEVAEICIEHDLLIASDEIHCGLTLDGNRHIPAASLGNEVASRTITLMSPSKTYNIPGLGCSFAIVTDPKLRSRFSKAARAMVHLPNMMGTAACLSAYRNCGKWLSELRDYLKMNRDITAERINKIDGLSVIAPEATYLAWIDTRDRGVDDPVAFFEKAGVGLSDGRDFGLPGYVRLNYGCPREILEMGLERMEQA